MIDYIVTRVPVSELSTEPTQGIQMPYTIFISKGHTTGGQLMIGQLNNLIQRLTGSKRKPTMDELCYHGTDGCGNTLIGRAYLSTDADQLGSIKPGCGNMLIAKAYFDADCGKIKPGCGNMLIAKAYFE